MTSRYCGHVIFNSFLAQDMEYSLADHTNQAIKHELILGAFPLLFAQSAIAIVLLVPSLMA